MNNDNEKRLVWDLPLRLFHWLLAISFVALWATAELGYDYMQYHFWLGYWMIGLLIFRVLWGFVGPRHARFASFFPTPKRVSTYLSTMLKGPGLPTIGHNPLGGMMVFVMLILLALQVVTGLFATDDIIWEGPYRVAVSNSTADDLASIHHFNINLLWTAVGLHVTAIAYYWWWKKQNLVVPMITGKKSANVVPISEAIKDSALIRALIIIVISAACVYGILEFAPEPPADEYYY